MGLTDEGGEPVDAVTLENGEAELPAGTGDEPAEGDAARLHAEELEAHSRPSAEPTDPAATRPGTGSSSRPADG